MSGRLTELAERQARLRLKSAVQRQQLGALVDSIDSRIRTVDRGLASARGFLQKPAVLAGGATFALLIGPRRVLRLAGQAVLVFAAARRLLRLVRL
ncbi:MAG: YqjK family protein [Alphaproteobacteria bacterium]